ncbi:hypothetical protein LJY25_08870 [Hymenobacter sp. BT175]|uniref:hypothetical protein n=1 Tax=Hymenobacter translucens TaxID=2886507 RepID=UPI001D0DDFA4|nr:hypothetical protein [Hymenobacter translucens]MCC2546553.1 hypothetical protein [Hymenobacter translucens]
MKVSTLALVALLGLGACQKSAVAPNVEHGDSTAVFDQEFALYYRQQAMLPAAAGPELTVQVEELYTSYCPEEARCIVSTAAWPTLRITDQQGQSQQVKLPANRPAVFTPAFLDTTSVQANGRRYLLTYTRWNLDRTPPRGGYPAKHDYTVSLRVSKPAQ